MQNDWTQVDILTSTAGIEPLGASLMGLGINGFSIQDAADFESFLAGKQGHWDYIDDDLMKLREAPTVVSVYLANNQQGNEILAAVRSELDRLRGLDPAGDWGKLTFTLKGVREEDWATAWKKYYHPVKIGQKLVVCPSWEKYIPEPSETVLLLDPGMAFGTGTHTTTRLCLLMAEELVQGGERVLDIGCGSGILSVASVLLGASHASGVDIDSVAVRVAGENAALNGVSSKTEYLCSNLAESAKGRYDIIFANIVADAIISLLPDVPPLLTASGSFILSGIIDTREHDVLDAVEKTGLAISGRMEDGGWVALRCTLPL